MNLRSRPSAKKLPMPTLPHTKRLLSSAKPPSLLKLLPRRFHSRSPEIVAQALLGKLLIRDLQGKRLTARITEVEAYLGLIDSASHAARGLTSSNAILFGPSGHVYVYFIYGMY